MIELLTISSGIEACGIREYANHLQANLPGDITMRGNGRGEWLDPQVFFAELPEILKYQGPQVIWLNYHAALHSRWNPGMVERLRQQLPVLVTYHDTGVPVPEQCLNLYHATVSPVHDQLVRPGRFIVHEPCDDLPEAIYLRQGVPAWQSPVEFLRTGEVQPEALSLPFPGLYAIGANGRPVLGSVGFPFPWKNYDLLAEATAEAGWSLLLLAPGAQPSQIQRWRALNPWTGVVSQFIDARQVVRYLAGCDATAFLYSCANTGTSGAIRQGIAARKPVLATESCRQFRDLWLDPVGLHAIRWISDLTSKGIANHLGHLPMGRLDPRIQRLAEQDSWLKAGQVYGELIRKLAA